MEGQTPNQRFTVRGHFLLLRMLVGSLGVPVGILAVVLSRGCVLLRFFMVAVIMVMGCLAMMMRRRLMLRSSIVMMLAGSMLLFLYHGKFLLKKESQDVSGQNARLTSVMVFAVRATENKKAEVAEHTNVLDHVGLLVNELPGTAGLPVV